MSETRIETTVTIGENNVKLAVYDDRYADPTARWKKLHTYFLSLELQTAEKLGIPLTAYRAWLKMKEKEDEHGKD